MKTKRSEEEIRQWQVSGLARQQNTVKILKVLDRELLSLLVERKRLLNTK